MKHTLKGIHATRRVWLDGKELSPKASQTVVNHSPDGFNWGYMGSGPAQLALAIMIQLTGTPDHHQEFKARVIAPIPQHDFEIEFDLIEGQEQEGGLKPKQSYKISRQKIAKQYCHIRAHSLEQATEYAQITSGLEWSDPDFVEYDYYEGELARPEDTNSYGITTIEEATE